jgi:alpha-beta hydrolase superfamily lysophospholipase
VKQTPVVLVHGAWFHLSSWEQWAERFTERGFAVHVLGWPGEAESAPEGRRHPEPSRDLGLEALIAHHEDFVRSLDTPPILIGHGLGGLLVQHLFSVGLGRAAVALSPMPDSALQDDETRPDGQPGDQSAGLTVPDAEEGFLTLPPEYFRQAFANAVGEDEAARLFEQHVVPTPIRLLADLGFGSDSGSGEGARQIVVDTATSARGPLLFVSGQEDQVIPDAITRAAYKAYGDSAAVTDLKQFADRGHTLVVDSGWRAVADHVLAWLAANGIEAVEVVEVRA